jgi:hypothetical protein
MIQNQIGTGCNTGQAIVFNLMFMRVPNTTLDPLYNTCNREACTI